MKFVKLSLLLVAMVWMAPQMEAQTFACVNSAAILAEMPEVEQMQSNLQAFQQQLQKMGQQMVQEYQAQEQDAIQKEQAGQLAPAEKQRILEQLQTKQEEIMAFEQEMQQKMVQKEQELLQPILDRVNTAISAVAEEKGYAYIFDLSSGAILYVDESAVVNDLVKAKL